MRNNSLLGVTIAAILLAVAAGVHIGTRPDAQPAAPAVSIEGIARLYSSSFRDTSGQTQSLAQWRGKTLVVNFWATWCPPCREEMPSFSRLQVKNASKGVQFVGIALDSADNVLNFTKSQPASYPLLVAEAEGPEVIRQLGNSQLALPYTVVFSGAGSILLARLGRISERELDALLQKTAATQ